MTIVLRGEVESFQHFIFATIDAIVGALDGLSAEELNWRPAAPATVATELLRRPASEYGPYVMGIRAQELGDCRGRLFLSSRRCPQSFLSEHHRWRGETVCFPVALHASMAGGF